MHPIRSVGHDAARLVSPLEPDGSSDLRREIDDDHPITIGIGGEREVAVVGEDKARSSERRRRVRLRDRRPETPVASSQEAWAADHCPSSAQRPGTVATDPVSPSNDDTGDGGESQAATMTAPMTKERDAHREDREAEGMAHLA